MNGSLVTVSSSKNIYRRYIARHRCVPVLVVWWHPRGINLQLRSVSSRHIVDESELTKTAMHPQILIRCTDVTQLSKLIFREKTGTCDGNGGRDAEGNSRMKVYDRSKECRDHEYFNG